MMHYLQRDRANGNGYEYATAEPRIANGDVSTTWGPQSQAHPFAETEATTWARLIGCMVTMFEAPPPPAVEQRDATAERRARVAAHLAEQERKAAEAAKSAKGKP